MIRTISEIIDELRHIPRATWSGSDPTIPPVLRPPALADIDLACHTPVFDDAGFDLPTSLQWYEAITAISQRLKQDGDGRVAGGPVGIDALAWYASFHDHSTAQWGIYIPLSSLPLLDNLQLSGLGLSRPERWRLAWDVLVAHEIVHFAVDYACAWFELLFHAPIRRALCDRITAGLAEGIFTQQSNYLEIEESLANGHVLRKVAASAESTVAQTLRDFIRGQPPGYRDGESAESDEGLGKIAAETLRSYLAVWSSGWNIDPGNPALDFTHLIPLDDDSRATCPVWVINDLETVGLPRDAVRLITCVQRIEETKTFRKSLRRLHRDQQQAWCRLKGELVSAIPNGADFKKWHPEGVWSVRVNNSVRAHLKQPHPDEALQPWLALDIGGHTKMGHD